MEAFAENTVRILWKNWFHWVMTWLVVYGVVLFLSLIIEIHSGLLAVLLFAIFCHNFFLLNLGKELDKIEKLNKLTQRERIEYLIAFYVFSFLGPVYFIVECIYQCYVA
jgi:hypothetical protein